jgi:hypothetical protein
MVKIILTDKILVIEYYKIKSNPFITNNIKSIQSKDEIYIDCNYNDFMILNRNYEKNEKTEKIEKIFDLIIEKNTHIYFDDEKHFERFLDSPYTVSYHNKPFPKKNNILFYLAYKKYDLINLAINYGLFDIIDINQSMRFYYDNIIFNFNILMFSCRYSNKISSNKIVKILLEHPDINVNSQDHIYRWSALMFASMYSNNDSTENTVKMLLEQPNINVNLQNNNGWSALMHASKYAGKHSTDNTVKMLLKQSYINVNLRNINGTSALMLASKFAGGCSTRKTVKMLLEHPNINMNMRDNYCETALIMARRHSSAKTVKILLNYLEKHNKKIEI